MTPQARVARLAVLVVVVSAHQSQAGRFSASASNICALRLGAQVWQRNQRDQRQQALPARQLLATDARPLQACGGSTRQQGCAKQGARGSSTCTRRRGPLPGTRRRTAGSGTPVRTRRPCQRGAPSRAVVVCVATRTTAHISAAKSSSSWASKRSRPVRRWAYTCDNRHERREDVVPWATASADGRTAREYVSAAFRLGMRASAAAISKKVGTSRSSSAAASICRATCPPRGSGPSAVHEPND